MPTVPQYGDPKVEQSPIRLASVPTNVPAEATGYGPSAERRDAALNSLLQNEIKMASEAAFLDADTQASRLQTDLEAKGKGLLGKDAATAPDVIEKEWEEGTEQILKNSSGVAQVQVQRALQARRASLRSSMMTHAVAEGRRYREQSAVDWLTQSQREAASNFQDDQMLSDILDRQASIVDGLGRTNGLDKKQIAEKVRQVQGQTLGVIIDRHIDSGSIAKAKELYEDHGPELATDPERQKRIATDIFAREAWAQVGGLRLEDGRSPDVAKMREKLMAMDSMPGADKEKAWDYIKGRAGEEIANRERAEHALDRSFLNEISEAKKKNLGLDVALRVAERMGRDPYDKSVKADLVRKLYAPAERSLPASYNRLWRRVNLSGDAERRDIDAVLASGEINPADWRNLQEDLARNTAQGFVPAEKLEFERLEALVKRKYLMKSEQEDALYAIMELGRGKTVAEKQAIFAELDKKVPGSGVIFDDTRLKVETKKFQAATEVENKIVADLEVPGSEASRVRDWLKANGRESSPKWIRYVLQTDPDGKEWRK